jgi:outer membrane protein OmpA-like peptidoglycan-associated protein
MTATGGECIIVGSGEAVAGDTLLAHGVHIITTALGVVAAGACGVAFRADLLPLLSVETTPSAVESTTVNRHAAVRPIEQRAASAGLDKGRGVREPAEPSSGAVSPAAFDVIRIDPEGTSVFAGRGPAGRQLIILANGVAIATVTANTAGQWAIALEHHFDPGDYEFALTETGKANPLPVGQRVAMHLSVHLSGRVPTAAPREPAALRLESQPSPVTFIYNEANFTQQGRTRAAAMAAYFKQQRVATATLSGHADERGSDRFNLRLSQERLDAVAQFLREAGYSGKLVLVPMGKRQPFAVANRPLLSREEVFALDRRVELRGTQ